MEVHTQLLHPAAVQLETVQSAPPDKVIHHVSSVCWFHLIQKLEPRQKVAALQASSTGSVCERTAWMKDSGGSEPLPTVC